ncbi:MAG: uncharacterized protein KVP18_002873 [Porospora cf. gigantea A]|uniref:uncharacterized protein n=1 Tax=Porospora cf. gigantea A TaxID=2853593 RepID=UPI00355A6225|nr:MAG: hypothetical protein KVP18_002873 [Porospora cf. gigantea A]
MLTWDSVKLSVRSLQTRIDTDLVKLQQLNAETRKLEEGNGLGRPHLLERHRDKVEDIRDHIGQSLANGDRMLENVQSDEKESPHVQALVQRHRAIFEQLRSEFQAIGRVIDENLSHAKLFASLPDRTQTDTQGDIHTLSHERNLLVESLAALADTLSQASATFEGLSTQNRMMLLVQNKGQQILQKFPQLQYTLNRVSRLQLREKLILSAITGGCVLLLYLGIRR